MNVVLTKEVHDESYSYQMSYYHGDLSTSLVRHARAQDTECMILKGRRIYIYLVSKNYYPFAFTETQDGHRISMKEELPYQ